MLFSPHREVAVNLVGDYGDAALGAEIREASECLRVPHYAPGIMWVGKYEETAGFVGYLREVVEVHLVAVGALDFLKRIEYHLTAVGQGHKAEGMVHRRLDNHLLSRFEERVDGHSDSLHHSRYERQPFWLCLPPVMRL